MANIKSRERDLRIDVVRGFALVWIFWNHIPGNVMTWLTPRNYGLSDSTEIFVFLAGVSFALAYQGCILREGFVAAWRKALGRVVIIYQAHLRVSALIIALALVAGLLFGVQAYLGATGLVVAAQEHTPARLVLALLMLQLRPPNLDVLPIYVVMLIAAVPLLYLSMRDKTWLVLALSVGLYAAAQHGLALQDLHGRPWVFNPFAWQLLFVAGMLAVRHAAQLRVLTTSRFVVAPSLICLSASALLVLSWHYPDLHERLPANLQQWLYPISKPNLDVLRLAHFFALALLFARWVPAQAQWLRCKVAQPFARIGAKSLEGFTSGIVLSFLGSVAMTELAPASPLAAAVLYVGVSILGLFAMYAWCAYAGAWRGVLLGGWMRKPAT